MKNVLYITSIYYGKLQTTNVFVIGTLLMIIMKKTIENSRLHETDNAWIVDNYEYREVYYITNKKFVNRKFIIEM